MASFRADEALVGLIALATIPWIIWILRRGVRDSQLPVGKGKVRRDERPGAFRILFALYVVAAVGMAYIGLDLLFGIGG
jgi:hypothetical protein